ncbi:amidohydrolase [Aliigemmobacter aestuarii]|nr:amidohydrolase [Gemmobacter aestuarii]
MLTNADLVELTAFRHALHRRPEVSGEERETAATIVEALSALRPDHVITGLGGHGVAAVFAAPAPGPTVMFRAELDALPITELSGAAYASELPGRGHLCGHDGHMTILMALARLLSRRPPAKGRVVLMFQPAEEDGSGAAAVLADPRFADVAPDWAFAIHNMPGVAIGEALLAEGPANCASMGLAMTFTGRTSHASQPEAGVSPAPALAELIPALSALGQGGALGPDFRLVTITHARLGEPAFGIAPGEAHLWATLRTLGDEGMADLLASATALAGDAAARHGLSLSISHHDVFHACTNDPEATAILARALDACGIAHRPDDLPMRGSEDFGRFGAQAKAAMVFLGSGRDHPRLHNPDYDFPDDLIPIGARIFERIARDLLD